MISRKILLLYCVFLLSAYHLHAQETQRFTNEKRAEYIYSFSKHVTWSDASFSRFTVGLLDTDSLLYYMMQSQAQSIKTIHSKPIQILLFHTIEDIVPTQVLFLKNIGSFDIQKVYAQIGTNQTLLLTEDFPFNKSMINFTVIDGKRNYEIFEQRLLDKKLKINPLLLSFAVKTKEDWEALYAKTEALLVKEQIQNVEYVKKIDTQQEYISQQTIHIEELEKIVNRHKQQLLILTASVEQKQIELQQVMTQITARSDELEIQELQLASLQKNVSEQQKILKSQSEQLHSQEKTLISQLDKIHVQSMVIYLFVAILLCILIFGYVLYKLFAKTKLLNTHLEHKNQEISLRNEQIARQNQEITDSILYARRIQYAILPPQEIITELLPDHFILFKPRDIVSGDYYWMTQIQQKIIIAAADCTGHGVPGAFMSLLGITFLNEIVHEKGFHQPHVILNELRTRIIDSLNKSSKGEEYKDGMDMAICVIDKQNLVLEYSGAYNSLYFIRNNELQEIKADKMPVGLSEKMYDSFTVNSQVLQKNDAFYMFSDGYADQFGGPKNKKFMSKSLKELLCSIHQKPMTEQKVILDSTIEHWRGNTPQIDDIIVIGIKI